MTKYHEMHYTKETGYTTIVSTVTSTYHLPQKCTYSISLIPARFSSSSMASNSSVRLANMFPMSFSTFVPTTPTAADVAAVGEVVADPLTLPLLLLPAVFEQLDADEGVCGSACGGESC